jgi:hypothetical protein
MRVGQKNKLTYRPFAHVALGQSGPLRKFRNAGGAVAMKGIKEA